MAQGGAPSYTAVAKYTDYYGAIAGDGTLVRIANSSTKLHRRQTTGKFLTVQGKLIEEVKHSTMTKPSGFSVGVRDYWQNSQGQALVRLGRIENNTLAQHYSLFWDGDNGYGSYDVEAVDLNESGIGVGQRYIDEPYAGGGNKSIPVLITTGGSVQDVHCPFPDGWGVERVQNSDGSFTVIKDNWGAAIAINSHGAVLIRATSRREYGTYVVKDGAVIFRNRYNYYGAIDLNDRNEAIGWVFDQGTWIFSPEDSAPRYLGDKTGEAPIKINNQGEIIFPGRKWQQYPKVWKSGQFYPLAPLVSSSDGFELTSVIAVHDNGQILCQGNVGDEWATYVLNGSAVSLEVDPGLKLKSDQEFAVSVVITHSLPAPATYRFTGPLLSADPPENVEVGEIEVPEEVVLSAENPVLRFTIPCKVLKRGYMTLCTAIEVTDQSGAVLTNSAVEEVLVDPLEVEIAVTKERHLLNQTPESEWSARARAINDLKRANSQTPYANLMEIRMKITNGGVEDIANLNIPAIRDILSHIKSTVAGSPGVPLIPVRLYAPSGKLTPGGPDVPGGVEVDLTNPADPTVINDVTLAPGESAEFAWVVEAFDGNPDPEVDDSVKLVFTPLILGSLRGKNVQTRGEKTFQIIDRPLLEWGVRPKDGRVNYPSGAVVRVEGYIENISTRNDRPAQDIRVMIFQKPVGNLGGGFMFESTTGQTPAQKEYAVFDLPAEGPGKVKDLTAVFRSLPTTEASSGEVRYVIRMWTLDDEVEGEESGEKVVEASTQAILKEGWMEEFEVGFSANREQFTREEQCQLLAEQTFPWVGLSPFLCGVVDGVSTDFTDSIIGLSQFLFESGELILDAGVGFAAWKHHTMSTFWKTVAGDPIARQALMTELYVQYETLVNLKVMASETASGLPMAFDAFVEKAQKSLDEFFDVVQQGDLTELKYMVGRFLGANPDLALEPLMVASAYMKMNKALIGLERTLTDDLLTTALEAEKLRKANTLEERLSAARKAKRPPETALLPGDVLSNHRMFNIFGVTGKQLKAIQDIAKNNGVIISLRSRNPISIKLLKLGKAYPKPQALKAKCVNKIDIDYLGYRESAFGKLELVEPRPGLLGPDGRALTEDALEDALDLEMSKIRDNLKGDAVLEAEIRSRMQIRAEEWNKCFLDKVGGKVEPGVIKTEIPVAFEADLQFPPGKQRDNLGKVGSDEMRPVTYEPVPGSDPRTWEVKMGGPKGGPAKAVTGDLDIMAILDEAGGLIRDPQKRIEVYKQLAAALDMQHGESYTFFLNNARKEYLADHVFGKPGAEAMVAVSGFGDLQPRAAFFKDNLSVIDNPGAVNQRNLPRRKKTPQSLRDFILRRGEAKEVRRAEPSGEFMLMDGALVRSRPPLDLVNRFTPTTIGEYLEEFFRLNPFIGPSLLARLFYPGASVEFSSGEDGQILQGLDANGEWVQKVWTEDGGWQTVPQSAPRAPRNGSGGAANPTGPTKLLLAPMSLLTESVAAGETRLEILDQMALQTPGDFFQPGDRVVINPGGTNQEIRVVQALGSLILTEPLQFDHDEGEMVALLPPLGPRVSLLGLTEGGEVNGRTGVELQVKAGSTTSTITRVEFYVGGVLLGESTGPDFRLPWLPTANGVHQIHAVAYDDNEDQAISETINVAVNHIGTYEGPMKGSYSGLLRDAPATHEFCGTTTLTTTPAGGYTLQLVMAGKKYRAKGSFDQDGLAVVELKRPRLPPLRVRLTSSTAPSVDQVLGVVTDGQFSGPGVAGGSFITAFALDRLVWHARTSPAPQAGRYTSVIMADDFALALGAPLGDGTAALTVSKAGRAKLACRLADGTGATISCQLSKDGRLPLYALLYKKKGMLSGWFRFADDPGVSDGAALVDWLRPQDPKAKLFKPGFATQVNLLASAYTPPPVNTRMIAMVNLGGNLSAIFEGGDLSMPLSRVATMDGSSRVLVPQQGAEGLVIKSVPKSGMVSGNFVHPETGLKTVFSGMMFQKQQLITGSFLAGPQGGGFSLEPNPRWDVTAQDAQALGSRLPHLAIRSPRARQVLPAGGESVTVTGTASHASGIAGVAWQVLKDGSLSEPEMATGTTNWSFEIPLGVNEGGLFTVFAKAVGQSGEQSNVVTSNFRILQTTELMVSVDGPGSVSRGFLGSSDREVGRLYKLTASPQRGKRFLGWTGSQISTARTISFLMEEGMILHAHFGD